MHARHIWLRCTSFTFGPKSPQTLQQSVADEGIEGEPGRSRLSGEDESSCALNSGLLSSNSAPPIIGSSGDEGIIDGLTKSRSENLSTATPPR